MPDLAYMYLSLNVMRFKRCELHRIYGFFIVFFTFSIVYHIFTYHCVLQSSLFDYFQFMPQDFVTLAENFKTFYSRLILFFLPSDLFTTFRSRKVQFQSCQKQLILDKYVLLCLQNIYEWNMQLPQLSFLPQKHFSIIALQKQNDMHNERFQDSPKAFILFTLMFSAVAEYPLKGTMNYGCLATARSL